MKINKKLIVLIIIISTIIAAIYYIEFNKNDNNHKNSVVKKEFQQSETIKIKAEYSGPELAGISGYINTDSNLTIARELKKGNIVLIDFWTYTCINCIRTLPYLKGWDSKYRGKGLTIIGVHTPEFEFEKDYENVKAAVDKYEINYAVVQDNDYETWRAFKNSYWPRKYIIDTYGKIVYDHIGEGGYAETEKKIQELLEKRGMNIDENISEETTIQKYRLTPELYLGYGFALPRNQDIGNKEGLQPEQTVDYNFPEILAKNIVYLQGKWKSNSDYVEAKQSNASLILNYMASSVNIVSDNLDSPVVVEVFINDKYLSKEQAGDDIQFDKEKSFVRITEPRLYNIIQGNYGSHKLTLIAKSEGFSVNAFTFG